MDFYIEGKNFRCMVPFMDLFNGAVEVEQCHLYNLQTDAIQVIAGKEYKKGQQVDTTNSRCL